jgi:hypothetical protein
MKTLFTRLFLAIAGLFLVDSSFAQEEKFGKIDPKWFTMKSYAADTSAAAVVLFDIGKTYFNYNEGNYYRKIKTKHPKICRQNWQTFGNSFKYSQSTRKSARNKPQSQIGGGFGLGI